MLTREQIEEIQMECRERGISVKNLLKVLENGRFVQEKGLWCTHPVKSERPAVALLQHNVVRRRISQKSTCNNADAQ